MAEGEGEFKRALPFDVIGEVKVLKQKVAELEAVCRVLSHTLNETLDTLSRERLDKAQQANEESNRVSKMMPKTADRAYKKHYDVDYDDDDYMDGYLR